LLTSNNYKKKKTKIRNSKDRKTKAITALSVEYSEDKH
jgi:hypothetical protein